VCSVYHSCVLAVAPETVLIRAPSITVKLSSRRKVEIRIGGQILLASEHALQILQTFAHPTSMHDALAILESKNAEDWIEMSTCILHLLESGVLQDVSSSEAHTETVGFDAAPIHVRMLNDRVRTTRFLAAIDRVVRDGDVVVDIGTGTGILAIAAARAGARHVYAIEEGSIGEAAKDMFAANGLADRITLIRGRSTQIDLPERADVLVSEILGNDIFDESILETTRDANERLLKPAARLVPARLRVFALPLEVPREEFIKTCFVPENLELWRSQYQIDFDSLSRRPYGHPAISRRPHVVGNWRRLAPPVLLMEIDLSSPNRTDLDASMGCTLEADGLVSGVLVYFEADLAPGVALSIDRDRNALESWKTLVWLLPDAIRVTIGSSIEFRYSFRGGSKLTVGKIPTASSATG
jgi:predicted nicotinamide N-methyase